MKSLRAAALSTVVLAGSAAAQEAEREDQNALFDRIIEEATTELFQLSPTYASYFNIPEEEAGGRYKDRFGTPGIEGHEELEAYSDRIEARLRDLDAAALGPRRQEYLAILLAEADVENELQALADTQGFYLAGGFGSPYVVTQIGGVHVNLPQFMTQLHQIASADDADAYIARLDQFDEQFAGAIELLEANAEAETVPPAFAIEGAIANAQGFIAMPAAENPLATHFAGAIADLDIEDPDALQARAVETIETAVYPAYRELIGALETLQSDATGDAGIWKVPAGDDLYDLYVKSNGESTLSGDEVHELGVSEVARIHSEMETIFADLGMTEGTIGERLTQLTEDPEQLFDNTPEGKEELLAYIRGLTREAEDVMDEYFLVTPANSVRIIPVPEYAQDGAPSGQYQSPAEDGSRPGTFLINLRDTAIHPRWTLPTLVYHETVPGHHFQLALATDAKETPLIVRQSASSTGFAEGWGLYSELFAKEIGLYENDQLGDLGRLQAELFRAVRLVVDSGMHAKKWTREEAIDYMVKNAGMERSDVETEIERYSVWPGQALAYKTGMLKIQELREAAETALGEDFDVARFHYEVLRDGGAPLAVLEDRIDAWVTAGGPPPDLD